MTEILRLQVQSDPEVEEDAPISQASYDRCVDDEVL
jgi:hypothetical protein